MSIEDLKVIDRISDNETRNETLLVISDHLEWGANEGPHLLLLQEKIADYIAFIHSGEIYAVHPSAKGKSLVIVVFFQDDPVGEMVDFFMPRIEKFLSDLGIGWRTARVKSSMN